MWVCPKCSNQISDGSKICRQCGAILEEVEDKALTEGGFSGQSDQGSATEEKQGLQVESNSLTDTSEDDEDLEETRDDQTQREQFEALPWTCKQCGEHAPGTFDACWKCGATREGLENPDFVTERPDGDECVQPDVASDFEGLTEPETETVSRCIKCRSSKIIPDVTVCDQGQNSDGKLKVVLFGNPDALVFKDRRYGEVKADICGDCGHIELRVCDPRELYEHCLKSLEE